VRRAAHHDRALLEQLRETAAAQRAVETVLARPGLLAHHARERVDRLGRPGRTGRVEEAEPVRDQDAAGARGRVREELRAAEHPADGTTPHDAVLSEVAPRDAPAAAPDVRDDRARELAAIEIVGPALRKHFQRSRQVRLHEPLTDGERLAVALIDQAALRRVAEDQVEEAV
jgi:hypothetical protein